MKNKLIEDTITIVGFVLFIVFLMSISSHEVPYSIQEKMYSQARHAD